MTDDWIRRLRPDDEDEDKLPSVEVSPESVENIRQQVAKIAAQQAEEEGLSSGPLGLRLDTAGHTVWRDQESVTITRGVEWSLFSAVLASHPTVCGRQDLHKLVQGDAQLLDKHISNLNRLLEKLRVRVEAVRGLGRKLVAL